MTKVLAIIAIIAIIGLGVWQQLQTKGQVEKLEATGFQSSTFWFSDPQVHFDFNLPAIAFVHESGFDRFEKADLQRWEIVAEQEQSREEQPGNDHHNNKYFVFFEWNNGQRQRIHVNYEWLEQVKRDMQRFAPQ